jgi:tRNA-specific 2-thiouridylase
VRVLVAMSGGVDSSVAAALLVEAGHDVVGATMKLWGGPSDAGCCSVEDVEDARRVADQVGIVHRVFNFSDDFEAKVVDHYVAAHAAGATPNPCIECNRHLKFRRFLDRAIKLGFDSVATGHHARVVSDRGRWRLCRGADRAKDQSYVLSVLGQDQLGRTLLPVGHLTKTDVRARASDLGLRTAAKPDSQEVCFISSGGGRAAFLAERLPLHAGRVVDAASGEEVGSVDAVELVTVGQRRGLGGGAAGGQSRRYAVGVDAAASTVLVGSSADLLTERTALRDLTWVDGALTPGGEVLAQVSAHAPAVPATFEGEHLRWGAPQRRVAPGQTVALYDADAVVGAGLAA